MSGCKYSTLLAIESGTIRNPSGIEAIASALGVDPAWLATGQTQTVIDATTTMTNLSPDEQQLVNTYRNLPEHHQRHLHVVAAKLTPQGLLGAGASAQA